VSYFKITTTKMGTYSYYLNFSFLEIVLLISSRTNTLLLYERGDGSILLEVFQNDLFWFYNWRFNLKWRRKNTNFYINFDVPVSA